MKIDLNDQQYRQFVDFAAAVFAMKKPADLGENADIIVFNSLKQLNGQILNSAAELFDDMPKQ